MEKSSSAAIENRVLLLDEYPVFIAKDLQLSVVVLGTGGVLYVIFP